MKVIPFQPNPEHFKQRCNYSPTKMTKAYAAVKEDHLPVQRAANLYGVPITTLKDRVSGRVSLSTHGAGAAPLLSRSQEKELVDHLKAQAAVGYGYQRKQVVALATEYVCAIGLRKESKLLGNSWFYSFMARWPELKLVQPSTLEVARARCVSEETVTKYYKNLEQILVKYNLKDAPERIYNIDEKGISSKHRIPKVVSCIKLKPQTVVGNRFSITVIGCGNAAGVQLPPYFVFPGKKMNPEFLKDATVGSARSVSDSGWSNTTIFKEYLASHFFRYAQGSSGDYKLDLYDGHKTHLHPDILEWAEENKIILFVLPAHSSHILQPLDVGCFGPFQKVFASEVDCFMKKNVGQVLNKYNIAKVASVAYVSALSPRNLTSSFMKTGVYPFNASSFDGSKLGPNKVWGQKSDTTTAYRVPTSLSFQEFLPNSTNAITTNHVETTNAPKPRNTIHNIVSGVAITEKPVAEKVRAHFKPPLKKLISGQKEPQGKNSSNVKPSKK